jgi:hypothetical protein
MLQAIRPGKLLSGTVESRCTATATAPPSLLKNSFGTAIMTDVQDIQRRIVELDVEHRDLDAVIAVLTADGHADQLQLRRLKKRKLQLKDHITLLKMQLVPDVPA